MFRLWGARTAVVRAAIVGSVVASVMAVTPTAQAASVTYTATQTIPVPPASTYAGSGGGDGWDLAFSQTEVFNVFHHNGSLILACHLQSDASPCWNSVVVSGPDSGFATPGKPALWRHADTGRLYSFATRAVDATSGVVCMDPSAVGTPGLFCGFTALSSVGDAPDYMGLTGVAQIGSRLYAFQHNASAAPSRRALLCFDTATLGACAGQPFAGPTTLTSDPSGNWPAPGLAAIGTRIVYVVGTELNCFDTASATGCAGAWPVAIPGIWSGDPFPMLSPSGEVTGVCLPDGVVSCFDLAGGAVAQPASLGSSITANTGWDGPAAVLGARVYLANGNGDVVQCYDWSTSAGCPNFPRSMTGSNYLYSVRPDPNRPACLWTNADSGAAQIQNFDAYSGGACGEGPVRVLASQFVVPTVSCQPATYSSLKVNSPAPSSYASGSVAFRDGNNNPISGAGDIDLDASGTATLTGLNLSTGAGLPQFLITLNNAGAPSAVSVTLSWTGTDDPSCVRPGTTVGSGGALNYVALGDSYSAGEGAGAGNYFQSPQVRYTCSLVLAGRTLWTRTDLAFALPSPATCTSYIKYVDNSCHRAPSAWSFVVAKASQAIEDAVQNAACSGAKINDVLRNSFKGEQPQVRRLEFLEKRKQVDLVTITIGGNDLGFSTIIADCFIKPIACDRGRLQDTGSDPADGIGQEALRIQNDVIPALKRAAPNARVVLVGYPRVLPQSAALIRCGQFTDSERVAVNRYVANINRAWKAAAVAAGVAFVDVYNALDGHELCTIDSHVRPIFGNPFNSEQGHPNIAGQVDYADAVRRGLIGLGIINS